MKSEHNLQGRSGGLAQALISDLGLLTGPTSSSYWIWCVVDRHGCTVGSPAERCSSGMVPLELFRYRRINTSSVAPRDGYLKSFIVAAIVVVEKGRGFSLRRDVFPQDISSNSIASISM